MVLRKGLHSMKLKYEKIRVINCKKRPLYIKPNVNLIVEVYTCKT